MKNACIVCFLSSSCLKGFYIILHPSSNSNRYLMGLNIDNLEGISYMFLPAHVNILLVDIL